MIHGANYGGNSQTLGFMTKEKKGTLVGVINPGEYKIGPLNYNEKITVITGEILINGVNRQRGESIDIKKKVEVVFKTAITSSYLREEIENRK